MIRERLEVLLWERADGAIDADDRRELEDYLAVNGDAEKLAEELVNLNDLLATIPKATLPAGLRGAIDRGLAGAQQPVAANAIRQTSTGRRTTESWQRRLLPLAAGLLIGAAVVHILHLGADRPLKSSDVVGTMISAPSQETAPAVELDLGGEMGTIIASRDGRILTVEAELNETSELHLVIEATSGGLLLVGISQTEGRANAVSADRDRIVLTADGPGAYRLIAETEHKDARARITARVGGETVAEHWLDPGLRADRP